MTVLPAPLRIYLASTDPLKDGGLYQRALEAASPERREKTLRYRFLKDRRLSLGAEMLLGKAMADRGLDSRELRYAYAAFGKPYLPDHPDFHFSISHSEEAVMLAAADREVGCDIERIRLKKTEFAIARRFFAPEETEMLEQAPEEEQETLFFRFWTLKESFMKATGEGFHLPPTAFQIVLRPNGSIGVQMNGSELPWSFAESGLFPGYRAAVCAENAAAADWMILDLSALAN